ncbi:MAG: mitochondrial fission ELM1 family protein [Gammaproteobacteria bacterium]
MSSNLNQGVSLEFVPGNGVPQDTVPPRVWLVMGYRAGENSQILALGEALGWPFEIKKIRHRRWEFVTSLACGTGLKGIVKGKSSPLEPPWPDLVISAGLLNEPVCRWIRKQANGKVRLVHIGRPWTKPQHFDVVVTTPQYRLPEHPKVLQNTMPLHRVTQDRLAAAAADWSSRFIHLPRPWIAVVMGGNSGPYTLGPKAGRRLGREAGLLAARAGGSLLVTTSSRTPPSALVALQSTLEVPAYVYPWAPDATENPYYAYLALADSLVVTGDSMAMLAEACATCKPVSIFDLGDGPDSMKLLSRGRRSRLSGVNWRRAGLDFRVGGFLYWQMMRLGLRRLTRDLGSIHQRLIASGRAVWLGEEFSTGKDMLPPDDLERAVGRVKTLFGQSSVKVDS